MPLAMLSHTSLIDAGALVPDRPSAPDSGSDATADARAALEAMLASEVFCKAPRMCRLLRFLVDCAVQGRPHELNEAAIGIAVFDRARDTYTPGEDPVVRVHMGRLREKIKTYYAGVGASSTLRIAIPLGTYTPSISVSDSVDSACREQCSLAVVPFNCITPDVDSICFTQGLIEELSHELFALLGGRLVVLASIRAYQDASAGLANSNAISHRLEGSVRVEGTHIRLALRLINARTDSIVWSERLDRDGDLSLASQIAIATSISDALQRFLAARNHVAARTEKARLAASSLHTHCINEGLDTTAASAKRQRALHIVAGR